MMIEEDLQTYLLAQSGVSAIVETRVYPGVLQQGTDLPAITYIRTSGYRPEVQNGRSKLAQPIFQIDCYGSTYSEVKALVEQVRLVLQGYSGSFGSTTVQAIRFFGDTDFIDSDLGEYRVSLDIEIWHNET